MTLVNSVYKNLRKQSQAGRKGQVVNQQEDEQGGEPADNMRVILTGSTGSTGIYLLEALLANPDVEEITCLNRSDDAQERQTKSHRDRGMSTDIDPDRLEFLKCDLSQDCLGLSETTYKNLVSSVTHIIHCAWPVNFNHHFSSFEPQIKGVRNLIEFAHQSRHHAVLFFISSISVATYWGALPGARATVPEIVLKDWRLAGMGYGQSKLVSERMLDEASKRRGVNTAICRVGQIAGPVLNGKHGVWAKREWVPSMIASSKFLGKMPNSLGLVDEIDWIPVDVFSSIVMELLPIKSNPASAAINSSGHETIIHHVANPNTVLWNALVPTVCQHWRDELEVVDFVEWCEALQRSFASDVEQNSDEINPAIKLWDYFDNLRDKTVRYPEVRAATLDVTQTVQRSPTLANLEAVSPRWMELWLSQWAF